jgi:hypothetical protein
MDDYDDDGESVVLSSSSDSSFSYKKDSKLKVSELLEMRYMSSGDNADMKSIFAYF